MVTSKKEQERWYQERAHRKRVQRQAEYAAGQRAVARARAEENVRLFSLDFQIREMFGVVPNLDSSFVEAWTVKVNGRKGSDYEGFIHEEKYIGFPSEFLLTQLELMGFHHPQGIDYPNLNFRYVGAVRSQRG